MEKCLRSRIFWLEVKNHSPLLNLESKNLMNVEEGIAGLIEQFNERKIEIMIGLTLWTICFSILFYLSQIEVIYLERLD